MDWIQALTVIGVNIALFGGMTTLVVFAVNKIDADVKSITTRLDGLSTRMDGHANRIDQLYQMFVSLLKEKN